MSSNQIPHLKVSGNPFEIGFQVGKHFKNKIHAVLEEFEDYKKHKNRAARKQTYIQKMLTESDRLCPEMIDEIRGMAEGSNVDFMDLFIHNSMHMPFWAKSSPNCSTSIIKQNDSIFIAHNEDAHPLLEKYAYYVFVAPENPYSILFFSHCYPGIIPGMSYGFNMAGIVQTCNSLPDPEKSIGIPRMFVGRSIYEHARTLSDVKEIIGSLKPRSGGANYNICSMKERSAVSIETTGTNYAVIPIQSRFFRANHYISTKFKHHPSASDHTITRQSRGEVLLPEIGAPSELLDIMRDNSIFLTMKETNNDCQTNSTLIFEITSDNVTMKKYDGKEGLSFKMMDLLSFK
ncbi:MAG: C45 family autoproteolytic acyltransferase/hydrolase [Promethearchaeota archaeon]